MTDFSKVTEQGIADYKQATKGLVEPLVELRLPFPPSVNDMYVNNSGRGRGRFPSGEYKAWKEQAAWELTAQKPRPVLDRCEVYIDLDDRINGDADNRSKPCLDILVNSGVLAGDSKKHVKRVSIGWEKLAGCRVRIVGAGE